MDELSPDVVAAITQLQAQPFGLTLGQLREENGLSQGALAKAAGISRPYLTQIENGSRSPSPEVAARLAAALGLEPGAFAVMTGAISVADLTQMQRVLTVMALVKDRLSAEEWAQVEDALGGASPQDMLSLYSRALAAQDPSRADAAEQVPGWGRLTPRHRRLVRDLVNALLGVQDIEEADHVDQA